MNTFWGMKILRNNFWGPSQNGSSLRGNFDVF